MSRIAWESFLDKIFDQHDARVANEVRERIQKALDNAVLKMKGASEEEASKPVLISL